MAVSDFQRADSDAPAELAKLRADLHLIEQAYAAKCDELAAARGEAQVYSDLLAFRDRDRFIEAQRTFRVAAFALVERDVRAYVLPIDLCFRRDGVTVACALGKTQRPTLLEAVEAAIDIGGTGGDG